MVGVDPTNKASRESIFASLWRRWLAKRHRDRVRALSRVRFRLTREGVHFVGLLLFVFLGAVIRDINLLILLAGAMIGLLLLQWRFNARTLLGLSARRRLPHSTSVARLTDVPVQVSNSKRWLGAWLVLIEDPLQKVLPKAVKLPERGAALVDEIRPKGIGSVQYQLTFHQRGRYRVGPSTLSTRFPLGLGRGARTVDNASEILVRPRLGQLTARVEHLFYQQMHGNAMSAPRTGLNEAEFYGLRPWATGDSRRWIHWRTTARLGELSVRQFERQQRRQLCVMLDLYQADMNETSEPLEKCLAFMATLATSMAVRGGDRLAVAVAGKAVYASPSVQGSVLVENLLDQLAIVQGSTQPDLPQAVRALRIPLQNNPYLLVISTREDRAASMRASFGEVGKRLLSRLQINWVNVSNGDLESYFEWT
jgi:uncharacterized protein (DUF58 family)